MQPAPLTGTATFLINIESLREEVDAARTPHGDSNVLSPVRVVTAMVDDAARTPHGDSNFDHDGAEIPFDQDAARTPHGDSNLERLVLAQKGKEMQPAPLTGTATLDGTGRLALYQGCSPHPSRGQQPV